MESGQNRLHGDYRSAWSLGVKRPAGKRGQVFTVTGQSKVQGRHVHFWMMVIVHQELMVALGCSKKSDREGS